MSELLGSIETACHQLCKTYLGGVWSESTVNSIKLNRLTEGSTNALYYCSLTNRNTENSSNEAIEVIIRFYGEKCYQNDANSRLSDAIIALLMSEKNIGPKVYGLFDSGEILKHYNHKHFRKEFHANRVLVKLLAEKLSTIHSLSVPIRKNKTYLFDYYEKLYITAYALYPIKQLIFDSGCETLQKFCLLAELDWLKKLIVVTESPIVFAHMDFRGGNIMVIDSEQQSKEKDLVICDFEYSGYSYRGIDFGTIFGEWDRESGELLTEKDFVDHQIVSDFAKVYIEKCVEINGHNYHNNKCNTVNHIVEETKVFTIASFMAHTLYLLQKKVSDKDDSNEKKLHVEWAEISFKQYMNLKNNKILLDMFFN